MLASHSFQKVGCSVHRRQNSPLATFRLMARVLATDSLKYIFLCACLYSTQRHYMCTCITTHMSYLMFLQRTLVYTRVICYFARLP